MLRTAQGVHAGEAAVTDRIQDGEAVGRVGYGLPRNQGRGSTGLPPLRISK